MNYSFNTDKFFYWILGVTAAVIPLPANNFSSISIILLILFWIFYKSVKDKVEILRANRSLFLVICIPFFMQVFGLIYTDQFYKGVLMAQLALPFLIYSLIIYSVKIDRKTTRFVLTYFALGTFVASLLGMGKAIYYKVNFLGDYFFYSRFSELLGKHTTTFSLFVVVSMLFLVYEGISKHRRWLVITPFLIFFLVALYFISTRISIIALGMGVMVLVFTEVKGKTKWLGFVVPLLLVGLYAMPNFQKRFEPSGTEKGDVSDIEFRKYHWKAVYETIEHHPILFGAGSGSNRDYLYDRYRDYQLTSAYELKYNAHNQFLEYALDLGIMGLLGFVFMLGYIGNRLRLDKNGLGLGMLTMFITYFLTESVFMNQSGVVTFSLLMTLLLICNPNEEESILKP